MAAIPLECMNAAQKQAVLHPYDANLIVSAGPGSGKTRVCVERVRRLLKNTDHSVLCVTFTKKAASEMLERLGEDAEHSSQILVGTFHSACVRWLRRAGQSFTILDGTEQVDLIAEIKEDLGLKTSRDDRSLRNKTILAAISKAKCTNTVDRLAEKYAVFYAEYEKRKANQGYIDFDDILVRAHALLRTSASPPHYDVLLVDEFQDTSMLQYEIVQMLARTARGTTVVGDHDQSIYAWRQADERNLRRFVEDFAPTTIKLETSYRSGQAVLDKCMNILGDACTKNLVSAKPAAETRDCQVVLRGFRWGDQDQAAWIADRVLEQGDPGNTAVLVRMRYQTAALEKALRTRGIKHRVVGVKPFYSRAEVRDVLAYVRTRINPRDTVAWRRAVQVPRRGVGAKTLQKMGAHGPDLYASVDGLPRTSQKLKDFVQLFHNAPPPEAAPHRIAKYFVEALEFDEYLRNNRDKATERWANVEELLRILRDYESIDAFLEEVRLSEEDPHKDNTLEAETVTISTIHGAKGLEWSHVFVYQVQEKSIPCRNTDNLGEENRLLYVAASRAKTTLYLTYDEHEKSRFLKQYCTFF